MKVHHSLLSLLAVTLPLLPSMAQQTPNRPASETPVTVAPERPTAEAPNVNPPPSAAPASRPPVPAAAANASVKSVNGGVLLNFQNASLNDVLTYLSEALGFVIVQEAPVSGTINLVSQQPLNAEEVVDVLNSTLVEKGYAAIRNGRILKIVNRKDAARRDIGVNQGSDPDKIQRNDTVVTQILPLHYGEAGKLVENLRPLLAETATISANDGSNAIIMTDTQTNIRRIAQIIKALDNSVSSISTITVFALKFADAKEVATIVTQLFAPAQTNQQQGNRGRGGGGNGGGGGGFGFGGPGGGGGQGQGGGQGGGGPNPAVNSAALTAASRVVAVADEQSNSVIVSSPSETIPVIREMIDQIDTSITAVTDTRIFRLINADATELAATITSLYTDGGATSTTNRQGNNNRGFGFPGFGGGVQTASTAQSGRILQQGKVTAVGDPRTNSLLVTAGKESMMNIAEIVGRLDTTTAKKQRVYTYQLKNTQPDTVADVLRGMLGQPTVGTQSGTSVLTTRSANGATMSTEDSSSSSNSRSGNR